jgi:oligoendopeptidase F
MSPKSKRNGNPDGDVSRPDEEIRRRAYEIYLERGEQHGRDLEDWLQAEREFESKEE